MKQPSTEECHQEWLRFTAQKSVDWATLGEHQADQNVVDYFSYCCRKYENQLAVQSAEHPNLHLTYLELLQLSRRIAQWTLDSSINGTVSLMMENRIEFPGWTLGLATVGLTCALININLRGDLLKHALRVAGGQHLVVSRWMLGQLSPADIEGYTVWVYDGIECQGSPSSVETDVSFQVVQLTPDEIKQDFKEYRMGVQPRDPFVYIYTSGTTGPSKAARFSHRRWIGCGLTWARPSLLEAGERYYVALPLYHGNAGAVALSAIFFAGCTAVIRQKFSVTHFFTDIEKYQCKYTVYVGEIWRYLLTRYKNTPHPTSPLRIIIGNGIRPDIWPLISSLFPLERIVEHYGATEMPGDAVIQWFNRIGSCGYIPIQEMEKYSGVLIRFDVETGRPVRDGGKEVGWGVRCGVGEEGELIMPLPEGKYDGYVDPAQTEKKLYRNVFEEGDMWYSSGDLLKHDKDGFFYFVDRTGDTFRWKGENVATTEVAEVLTKIPEIEEANVYGVVVPGNDGKAGMVSLLLSSELNPELISRILKHALSQLPRYAVPLFLRVKPTGKENDKTSTYKYQKHGYSQQGYDPSKVSGVDCVFVVDWEKETYVKIDQDVFTQIQNNQWLL